MSGTRRWTVLLLLGGLAAGCTGEATGGRTAGPLKIACAQEGAARVGSAVDLRLRYAASPGPLMTGAMIQGEPASTRWFADPADAVEFEAAEGSPSKARARFRRAGPVTVWAIYREHGKEIRSEALRLVVAASEVEPAAEEENSSSPAAEGVPKPSEPASGAR
ncbi:MAG: hypothetical protein D6731_26155 [Planctomycetota bacterium]|nr:MAG: hypothetical protein D6731_26155 [Planctomycetota bacterium]